MLIHCHFSELSRLSSNSYPECRFSDSQHGQSIVESCIVVGLVCLLFMGLFQLSQLYMARQILDYAAGRGARAKAVGFNDVMVYKTIRIATIAVAGQMTFPEIEGGPMTQRAVERGRIPLFLGSESSWQLPFILDYEDWETINYSFIEQENPPVIYSRVSQYFPLDFEFHRAFYAGDSIHLSGEDYTGNHYPLYLDPQPDSGSIIIF